ERLIDSQVITKASAPIFTAGISPDFPIKGPNIETNPVNNAAKYGVLYFGWSFPSLLGSSPPLPIANNILVPAKKQPFQVLKSPKIAQDITRFLNLLPKALVNAYKVGIELLTVSCQGFISEVAKVVVQ